MNIYDTNESDVTVLSYGGGVQSVAMCVLAATGRLPSPDHIYLHQSRTPLATADLDVRDRGVVGGDACGFGRCWL